MKICNRISLVSVITIFHNNLSDGLFDEVLDRLSKSGVAFCLAMQLALRLQEVFLATIFDQKMQAQQEIADTGVCITSLVFK